MEIAQTADYALRVLLALETQDGRTIAELAQDTGLHRSVVHRIVSTLRRRAAVTRDVAGRFWLGPLLVRLGRDLPHELAHIGRDELAGLAARSQETVVLAVREGAESVVVAQERGHRGPLRVEYEVDFRQPIDRGASSLAILAHAGDADRFRAIADRLAEIRSSGIAQTLGEIKAHMIGVAVPILTRDGVGGSLAIVAPLTRRAHIEDILPDLVETGRRISVAYDAYLAGHTPEGAVRQDEPTTDAKDGAR